MKLIDIIKLITVLLFISRIVCRVMHIEGTQTIQIAGAIGGVIFFGILAIESWEKRKVKTD